MRAKLERIEFFEFVKPSFCFINFGLRVADTTLATCTTAWNLHTVFLYPHDQVTALTTNG